jgi:hypothetical protein
MSKKKYALNFELGNEVSRLENANSFDLYILKTKIERCLNARKVAKYARETICGSKEYVYYDVSSEQEEIIVEPSVRIKNKVEPNNGVLGIRKRDGQSVIIDFEAIDLTRSSENLDADDTNIREKIDRPWELPHRSRIAVRQYIHLGNQQHTDCFIVGYIGKWNHGSIRLKTLSGETIIVKGSNIGHKIYHLTNEEHKLFDGYENDKQHQGKLKDNIYFDILNYCDRKDLDGVSLNRDKIIRSMIIMGHEPDYIEECIAFEKGIEDSLDYICEQAKEIKERQEIEHA